MEFPEQITIGITFFYFAYVSNLGLLQILAARHRRPDLSPLGGKHPWWGYIMGTTLILLAFLWFFGTRGEEIFSPGPASSEFFFFFSLGLTSALATSIFPARLFLKSKYHRRGQDLGS